MIEAATQRHHGRGNAVYSVGHKPRVVADYGIASGIFNVRLKHGEAEWLAYVKDTLDVLDRASSAGFSCNFLTSYSDPDKMRDNLYYADPCFWFDYCKQRYSRHVALLHDYGLYEFTVLVRK
jgi:hypothetical protein